METQETDVEISKRIEYFKSRLTPRKMELYNEAKSFWSTPEGKKAIKESLRRRL